MSTTTRGLLALTTAVLMLLAGTVPATAAASIGCGDGKTYGWVTAPVNGLPVGSRHCRPMTQGDLSGQYAFWFKSHVNGAWIPTSNNKPNFGGSPGSAGRAHAEAAWALGKRWGVKVNFTKYVGNYDRKGWIRRDGSYGFHGAYYPAPTHPGRGLIEISAGGSPLGYADAVRGNAYMRQAILNVVRHEIAHARIEHWCGTWAPPIVRDRAENVTDAYAVTFLRKTNSHYSYTSADVAKARSIAKGDCG
jgi:hypothetical protein